MKAKYKLVKGLSYCTKIDGVVISASRTTPEITVETEIGDRLPKEYFTLVSSVQETPESDEFASGTIDMDDAQEQEYGKTLEEMTISDLETFATYHNVKLGNAKTKEAIVKKLEAALPDFDFSGKITWGSPTMVELQQE